MFCVLCDVDVATVDACLIMRGCCVNRLRLRLARVLCRCLIVDVDCTCAFACLCLQFATRCSDWSARCFMPSIVSVYAMLFATLVLCDCEVGQKVCPGDDTACASAIIKFTACQLNIATLVWCGCVVEQKVCSGDVTACARAMLKYTSS